MVDKINLLDHGFVRLLDFMGTDVSIVRAARVSYDAAWRTGNNEGSDARLIQYLWRNGHTSPFEAVEFQFEVKAPIFVFRQWQRHRVWSFSELSARYRELPEEFYVPEPNAIGQQAKDNKQARVLDEAMVARPSDMLAYREACAQSFQVYKALLKEGWPREIARGVLPLSTYSHMFAKVNLLNLFKFLTLRMDPHSQWEIRQYAEALVELIRPIVPVAVVAWEERTLEETQ
jgi:thymidylate synthase (FAD)